MLFISFFHNSLGFWACPEKISFFCSLPQELREATPDETDVAVQVIWSSTGTIAMSEVMPQPNSTHLLCKSQLLLEVSAQLLPEYSSSRGMALRLLPSSCWPMLPELPWTLLWGMLYTRTIASSDLRSELLYLFLYYYYLFIYVLLFIYYLLFIIIYFIYFFILLLYLLLFFSTICRFFAILNLFCIIASSLASF